MSRPLPHIPSPTALGIPAEEVLHALPSGCLAVDADWRITYCNPAAEAVLDARADELIGRPLFDAFPEAAGSVFHERYATALRDRRPVSFTAPYPPLDRWFSVHAVPHGDALIIHFHDVSEHVRDQQRATRYAQVQEVVGDVATAVAAEAPPEAIWQLVADRSAALVDAHSSWVFRFEDGGYRILATTAAAAPGVPATGDLRPPVLGAHGERLRLTGKPVWASALSPAGSPLDVRALAAAPVRVGGDLWGGVAVTWGEERPDVEEDLPWIVDLADLVALAGINADARERLARRAETDALTGLANLEHLHRELDARISAARRHGRALTLGVIDVDHFKTINDGYGHAAGDRVLQVVAGVLRDACRREDLAARIGGDEFALVLDGTDASAALVVAGRVREAVGALELAGAPPVTLSVGLCEWAPGLDREQVQRRADDALYWAKLHGRDSAWAHDGDVMDAVKPQERAGALRRAGTVLTPAHVEERLRGAREFWRSTLDALEEHVAVLDEHGRVLATNAAWAAHARSGAAAAVAVGDDYVAAWRDAPIEGAAAIAAGLEAVVRGERPAYETEYTDGSCMYVLRLTRWARDTPRRVVVHREDVTEHRRAQQELRRQSELLSKVPAAVVGLSLDGRVRHWNLEAERLFGWPAGEAVGAPMRRLIVPARERARVPDVLAAIARGEDVDDETVVTRRCGAPFHVHARLRPVLDGDGTPIGAIGVLVDITAQQELRERERARLEREAAGLRWAAQIRAALEDQRFELHAQPIVALDSGQVSHHELLLRLRDPAGTLVAPGDFLPAAEEHGLMADIDAWVVEQAAELASRGLHVHMNLSAQSIGDAGVLGRLRWSLQRAAADPALVTIEVTETAVVGHAQEAAQFARVVHALGCRLALDDFGTGYNSLARLKHLPVDAIKIDQQFVRDVLTDAASGVVVRAIVSLAADLGVVTVAEGVETDAIARRVRELGVTHGQGWRFGRPGPIRG